jgi:hypothetical protein
VHSLTSLRMSTFLRYSSFFVFWWDWSLYLGFMCAKQAFYPLSHNANPFCSSYFGDTAFWTISLGCPWATILPISASQVAIVVGVIHQLTAAIPHPKISWFPLHHWLIFFWVKRSFLPALEKYYAFLLQLISFFIRI